MDANIIYEDLIEFIIDEMVYISYDPKINIWMIHHRDEGIEPNNIIIPEDLDEDLFPFDNYHITVDLFNNLKEIIKNIK